MAASSVARSACVRCSGLLALLLLGCVTIDYQERLAEGWKTHENPVRRRALQSLASVVRDVHAGKVTTSVPPPGFARVKKSGPRVILELNAREALLGEDLARILTRQERGEQDGTVTYTYPGRCAKTPPCTRVTHVLVAGRLVIEKRYRL